MKVAVLGCGTIGKGVVDILLGGIKNIELAKILDRKDKFVPELINLYTDNIEDILADSEIEAVVETMGGRGFSYTCVKKALEHGKSVVTANKELIAYHLAELTALAEEKGVYLLYEASVGGGIPFIKTLSNLAEINKTESIVGILNGTTNYILTKMQKDNASYEEALLEAQKLGYAERDPSADVDGHDLVRKIAIISMLSYKQEIALDKVWTFGISSVTKEYINFIKNMGYVLKFVCFSSCSDKIEIGVEPILVRNDEVIANINYADNIVKFKMDPNDELTFIGKGAGRYPTATAIVSDLEVIRDKGQKMKFENKNNFEIAFENKKLSAIVQKGNKNQLLENVDADSVRHGGYDFYAVIYKS